MIIPLFKKGSRSICQNYRRISLLSVPSKVYARVLNQRIRQKTGGSVMEEQGGFRKRRNCIDQICTVRQGCEKVREKEKSMAMACVNLEKVYDKVGRGKLWQVLEEYGVRGLLLRAVRSLYRGNEASV